MGYRPSTDHIMPNSLKLECHLTADDYIQAVRLNHRPRRAFLWLGILLLLLFLAFSVFEIYLKFTGDPNGRWPILHLSVVAYITGFYGWWLPRRVHRIFSQQKSLQKPYRVLLNEDKCTFDSEDARGETKWNDFHKWKCDDTMILLHQSDAIFLMFPRRWFKADADFHWFIELLTRKLGEPK